jgi:hypothetical protein
MKAPTPLKLRVSLACLSYAIAVYLLFMRQVVVKMTGNANFITPMPPLLDVTTGLDDLQAKAEAAHGGGRDAYAARNAAWATSVMQARELANYVQLNCQNDLTILLSSGFISTKTPAPVGPLSPPTNLRVSYNGYTGQVVIRVKGVPGVTAGYTYQQAETSDGPFVNIGIKNKTFFTATGLTPGKMYWFCVCANGADQSSPPCAAVCKMAV